MVFFIHNGSGSANDTKTRAKNNPQQQKGYLTIAGKKIRIHEDAVPHTREAPPEELLKALQDAATWRIFPPPPEV